MSRPLPVIAAVDPGHASAEVKQALKDYVAAMEQSFEAMTNHEDLTSFERIGVQKAKDLYWIVEISGNQCSLFVPVVCSY